MLKTHAKRESPYDPQIEGKAWTLCMRNVEQPQIAAFVPDGVTCKQCLATIAWREENEREWIERRKQEATNANA